MTNRLYVSNLPADATEDALRRHFASCGGVSDVELGSDRGAEKSRGLARVTMTSAAYAIAAVARLDRAPFEGRMLRVSESPLKAQASTVRIVQQFRERATMAYDLDCAGMPLTIRVVPLDGGRWQIEARSTDAGDAVVVDASGASRREALDAVLRAWNDRAAPSGTSLVDADGLVHAMVEIRAV